MSEHYYTQVPSAKDNRKSIIYQVMDTNLEFITSSGVFSKDRIDFGSDLLIKCACDYFVENGIGTDDKDINILDVGAGYGAVALSLCSAFKNFNAVLVDVNSRAIELCKLNAKRFNLENRARAFESDLFNEIDITIGEGIQFDYIFTNPPIRAGKDVVFSIYMGAKKYLKKGGSLFVVIQKKQGAESSLKKLQEIYPSVSKMETKAGYWILRAQEE